MTLSPGRVAATVAMAMAVQAFTAFALAVAPVLAPVAAFELGMPAARVGNLVALSFFTGIFAGLVSATLLLRYGPVGTFRIAIVLGSIGLALSAGSNVLFIVLYAIVAGFAHGLVNPPASQLLMMAAPPHRRSLIFSIKQCGVPLGMALAGVLLPPLLIFISWQQAVLALAVLALGFLFMLQPFHALFDRDRRPHARLALANIAQPLKETLAEPRLRQFVLFAGAFALVQPCVTTYLVSFLHLEIGYSLIAAGLVFSTASIAGVVGRVLWGALADWSGSPRRVLAGLGLVMGLCCIAAAFFTPDWPFAAVMTVCALWGASAVGWNGVCLAEVARLAPEGKAGSATSGAQVYIFAGTVAAPPLFGLVAASGGSFSDAYLWLSPVPIVIGVLLLMPAPAVAAANPNSGAA